MSDLIESPYTVTETRGGPDNRKVFELRHEGHIIQMFPEAVGYQADQWCNRLNDAYWWGFDDGREWHRQTSQRRPVNDPFAGERDTGDTDPQLALQVESLRVEVDRLQRMVRNAWCDGYTYNRVQLDRSEMDQGWHTSDFPAALAQPEAGEGEKP